MHICVLFLQLQKYSKDSTDNSANDEQVLINIGLINVTTSWNLLVSCVYHANKFSRQFTEYIPLQPWRYRYRNMDAFGTARGYVFRFPKSLDIHLIVPLPARFYVKGISCQCRRACNYFGQVLGIINAISTVTASST